MKKLLGLSAMAMLGVMGMNSITTNISGNQAQDNVRINQRNQNQNNESQPITSEKIFQAGKAKQEASKGYTQVYYRNEGISPKAYGMYCVRKGTHKKSNI